MHARQIDSRDQSSEDLAPAYRVFFWDDSGACSEWELTNTDLDGALAWIKEGSAGRSHSLWITATLEERTHVARLRGIDPPAPAGTWPAWAREAR
jgi:hypothetical protein